MSIGTHDIRPVDPPQRNWAFWLAAQSQVFAVVEGHPGFGKTAETDAFRDVISAAKSIDYGLYKFDLAQEVPESFVGVCSMGKVEINGVEHECARYVLDERMLMMHHTHCVVVLDEPNTARPDTLAAAHRFLNRPPANAIMVGSMNPVESSTGGCPLSPPVVNRAWIGKWEPSAIARYEGSISAGTYYGDPDIPIVPADARETYGPKWGLLKELFLNATGSEHLDPEYCPPEHDAKPWPTTRSWENFQFICASAEACGASKTTFQRIGEGTIGSAASTAFWAWYDKNDLASPQEWLDKPHTIVLPARFDLCQAIISGVLGVVKQRVKQSGGKAWEQGMDVLIEIFKQNREVGLSAHGSFWKTKPKDHEPMRRDGQAWRELTELTTNKQKRELQGVS